MTRRLRTAILAAALITAASTVAMANRPVTYILTNGERISGELTYKGGREFSLIVNGRTIDFEPEQVAVFAFVPGDPPTSELRQLPSSGHAELERDMIVMRDGRIIRMKLYSISDDGETIRYDTTESGQVVRDKKVPSADVARMYVLGTNARQAFASRIGSQTQTAATSGNAGAIQVPANQQWTDTGLTVRRGERVAFYANGEVNLSADGNPAFTSNAGGNPAMTMPRGNLPVKTSAWGTLIGRVGAGQPFAIGSRGAAMTMPAAGRLYLGVNDAAFEDNSGAFSVTIVR